jgi:hypothetical protein
MFNIRRASSYVPHQKTYPAARQIGQGPHRVTDSLYIWNNSGEAGNTVGLIDYQPDECGNNQTVTDYIKQNRDYFIALRPNYSKFTYRHPLGHSRGSP